MSKGNKTVADRQQYVVKANELIRKTRYSLTTQQQKLVLFAISKIKPTDAPDTVYHISIEELCKACGLAFEEGGYYYKSIKDDLKVLTRREWCRMPDNSQKTISWIGDASITPWSGTVDITFNPHMAPYLFDLRERYTQYKLENVLVFKGKYAIRLYEILRSYTTQKAIDNGWQKNVSFSVDELKDILDVDSYPRWADFDRYVVRKAVDEINQYSDELHIHYDTYKTGRTVTTVNFIIGSPSTIEMVIARQERRKRLR